MNSDLLLVLSKMPYFNVAGLVQLGEMKAQTAKVQLSRWEERGLVVRLKKGVYTTRAFVNHYRSQHYFPLLMSTIINSDSYVSREYVLQLAGVLTDATYPVTAVTVKNTLRIENTLGTFDYGHVKPDLYQGYMLDTYHGMTVGRASKAKALFDYLYLRPMNSAFLALKYNIAEELRLDLNVFDQNDCAEFGGYVEMLGVRKMTLVYRNFKEYAWRD